MGITRSIAALAWLLTAAPLGAQTVEEKLAALTARIAVLEKIISDGDIVMRSNVSRAATQDGITDSYAGRLELNGWDGGFRALQNWNHEGTKRLPFGTFGMDSRSAFSYNWYPAEVGTEPDNVAATAHSNPNHPLYAPYRGQTLIIDGGSQTAANYSTGQPLQPSRAVLIAAQRAGWPIYFAVSPTRPNGYPTNRAVMKLNSHGTTSTVFPSAFINDSQSSGSRCRARFVAPANCPIAF